MMAVLIGAANVYVWQELLCIQPSNIMTNGTSTRNRPEGSHLTKSAIGSNVVVAVLSNACVSALLPLNSATRMNELGKGDRADVSRKSVSAQRAVSYVHHHSQEHDNVQEGENATTQ
jgi:hypothetical protein